jgi:large subunit ribosomal protein L23
MAIFEKKDNEEKAAVSVKPEDISVSLSVLANKVLLRQRLTEKAFLAGQSNQYVFQIATSADKGQVRRAVEAAYGVHVEGVQTVTIPPKSRNFGKSKGFVSGMKKAIVKLKKGESLAFFKAE